MDQAKTGQRLLSARAANNDMRRAAANLALIIKECGVSQSELARRSGVSRQLINGWARQRLSVSLSATVGRVLGCIQMGLADLLLDERALYAKLGKPVGDEAYPAKFLSRLRCSSRTAEAHRRLAVINGTFRYRTRLKQSPVFVLERTLQFQLSGGHDSVVKAFDGPRAGNKSFAEGFCLYHQAIFFVFLECTEPPYQPLIYAYRDLHSPEIRSMNGVLIEPNWFGANIGCPLTTLVYMHRTNADGSALSETDFDPEVEFNIFIPADACTVLTT